MFSFFKKRTRLAGILTAALFTALLLFAACEQPAGVVHDDDATLLSLSVDKGTLNPAFSALHSEYRVTVRNSSDEITVTAAASSGKAKVSGAGTKTLDVGSDNTITVGVRAESGASKTYTITVRRLDASVFGIETAEDMAKIGVEDDWSPAREYVLLNDITLDNWSTIDGDFSGIFDGDGNTITLNGFDDKPAGTIYVQSSFNVYSGANVTVPTTGRGNVDNALLGIFASVKGTQTEKAEVKNLKIDANVNTNPTVVGEGIAVGLVAGYGEYAVFDNITLSGTLTSLNPTPGAAAASTGLGYAGGVVAIARGEGTVIKNCTSSLTIDINPRTGALVHRLANAFSYVGGIVAYMEDSVGIENCHTTGDVRGCSTITGSQVMVGGILGGTYYNFSDDYHGYITGCSSTGNITTAGMSFWPFAGGIAGNITGGKGTLENSTRITNCFATGIITIENTASNFPYLGGIVGYVYMGGWVSQCYFTGKVIVGKTNDYTGGIAGYISYATSNQGVPGVIEDCWSSGEVTGFNNAGGIVGQHQQNSVLRRCYSIAVVKTTNNSNNGVGGITGLHASNLKDVTNTSWTEWKTKAVTACVALNPSVTAKAGNNVKRVSHQTTAYSDSPNMATMSNNYAWSDMDISTGGEYTSAIGENEAGGADCAQNPNQAFYVSLGWDFTNVWKMGADGYPKLQWQK